MSTKVSGRVQSVAVADYQRVKAGDLLVQLKNDAWSRNNFFVPQIVMGGGFAIAFTGLVSLLVQNVIDAGALSSPFNLLTYSAFVHTVRLFGGESGSAIM